MTTPTKAEPCPVCSTIGYRPEHHGSRDAYILQCMNCGHHCISGSALAQLRGLEIEPNQRAAFAHRFSKLPADLVVTSYHLTSLLADASPPSATECIDNLVLFLAAESWPGGYVPVQMHAMQATIGVGDEHAVQWVTQEAIGMGLLEKIVPDHAQDEFDLVYRLKVAGWQHHENLLKNGHGSRHAFMAMDFNDAELGAFFTDHLQPAVLKTGFTLRTTDHADKTAELIDNRMRVELRTSRFVVCDLTHGNRGAYWEAGFAEGIGRPVFYICRHDVRSSTDKAVRPHFDTAHQPVVSWNAADPGPGLAELKAMIRATLPAEARMQDQEQAN